MGAVTDNHNFTVESSEVEIWAVKFWGGFRYVKLQRIVAKFLSYEESNNLQDVFFAFTSNNTNF